MNRTLLVVFALAIPLVAGAITEPKTETVYPDEVAVSSDAGDVILTATGVGLREKTFMKVDVYTIVSYVSEGTELGEDAGFDLLMLDAPKRLQMDLRRGFSREKLINAGAPVPVAVRGVGYRLDA